MLLEEDVGKSTTGDGGGEFSFILFSVRSYLILHTLRGPSAESELGVPSHWAFITQEGQRVQYAIIQSLLGQLFLIHFAFEWAKGAGI